MTVTFTGALATGLPKRSSDTTVMGIFWPVRTTSSRGNATRPSTGRLLPRMPTMAEATFLMFQATGTSALNTPGETRLGEATGPSAVRNSTLRVSLGTPWLWMVAVRVDLVTDGVIWAGLAVSSMPAGRPGSRPMSMDAVEEASRLGGSIILHEEKRRRELEAIWEALDIDDIRTPEEVFFLFRMRGYRVQYHRVPTTPELLA